MPRNITRREFGVTLAKAAGVAVIASIRSSEAQTTDPPFTVVVVPDPQYLAGDAPCAGSRSYRNLINWAIRNRNLSVTGTPLNIKGFIHSKTRSIPL
jgi:hypothetical protein